MTNDNNREFQALVSLIDEPDQEMYEIIEKRILEYGVEIMPFLKETLENSFRENVQSRLKILISKINFTFVRNELKLWKNIGAKNLMHGLYLVARYRYEDLGFDVLKKKIAEIQHDIWIEMNSRLTLLEKIKVFNHVLYDVYGFKANRTNFHHPSNSYINEVLDKKTGNPILLACVYIILAQNLGLPVYGANVPEHFVCVVVNEGEEDNLPFIPSGEPLFYINAFREGDLFTKVQLSEFLSRIKVPERPEYFLPCSNLEIMYRVLNNLSYSYKKLNETERYQDIEDLKSYLMR